MPKRKESELTPAEQYERFKEAAEKAGVTKCEKEFERAFRKIAAARQHKGTAASVVSALQSVPMFRPNR